MCRGYTNPEDSFQKMSSNWKQMCLKTQQYSIFSLQVGNILDRIIEYGIYHWKLTNTLWHLKGLYKEVCQENNKLENCKCVETIIKCCSLFYPIIYWAHKISLTPLLFIEIPVLSQESEQSCICGLRANKYLY